ncbi:unnamed protein product [Brassica oleracea]|uniref:(rape) hypothetical protein n=1 Tax=Brassica napus TaxID=3708 RepID=A0A816R6F4_BRANA|nr:unnamed protein product [Brassica napus]
MQDSSTSDVVEEIYVTAEGSNIFKHLVPGKAAVVKVNFARTQRMALEPKLAYS